MNYLGMVRTCIYFVGPENGPIKIGKAKNVKARLGGIQTGHPEKLYVWGVMLANERLENALHRKFSDSRMSGEWFKRSDEILRFIEQHTLPSESAIWERLNKSKIKTRLIKPSKEQLAKIRKDAKVRAEFEVSRQYKSWFIAHVSDILGIIGDLYDYKHIIQGHHIGRLISGEMIRLKLRRIVDRALRVEWRDSENLINSPRTFRKERIDEFMKRALLASVDPEEKDFKRIEDFLETGSPHERGHHESNNERAN